MRNEAKGALALIGWWQEHVAAQIARSACMGDWVKAGPACPRVEQKLHEAFETARKARAKSYGDGSCQHGASCLSHLGASSPAVGAAAGFHHRGPVTRLPRKVSSDGEPHHLSRPPPPPPPKPESRSRKPPPPPPPP
mmetsp:Transcript_53975/g.136368  ORF Transcript_53975/g.136368 Transcript_53975/m.136368 type:complete len:137 (-) Transcript_53975:751-1161(-)